MGELVAVEGEGGVLELDGIRLERRRVLLVDEPLAVAGGSLTKPGVRDCVV